MKKLVIAIIFSSLLLVVKGQEQKEIKKSIWGVQAGFLGVWLHNETTLAEEFVLRTEVGLDAGIWWHNEDIDFLMCPTFTVEPRWYYNLNKRARKGKDTNDNSANFLTLKTFYNPDWSLFTTDNNVSPISGISFIPTWGIKRNINPNFNYELGFGIGYRRDFNTGYDKNSVTANLHLRIGLKL